MASSSPLPKTLVILIYFLLITCTARVQAQLDKTSTQLIMMTDALEWPKTTSLYDMEEFEEEEEDGVADRRLLFWRRHQYYISYGALLANRIPCPPRSGRSYYTHNCFKARGPANPYIRGCSAITSCRR